MPNLDYKIMQGDSLIDEFYGHKFKINEGKNIQYNLYDEPNEIEKLVNEAGKLQDEFINSHHRKS